jgi:hypothetical protein
MVTALAALLALPARSRAEDEITTPESRAKKVMAAFPEPSAALAFSQKFDLLMGTTPMGTIAFSAAVAEEDGEKVWKFTEAGRMGPMAIDAEGLCGKDLRALGGEHTEKGPDGEKHVAWERTEGGYAIEATRGDGEGVEKEASAPGGAVWGFGGLVLFCRMIPADAVEYVVPLLNPDADEGEELVQSARVRVAGPGKFYVGDKSAESWNCVATKPDGVLTLSFDPARKTLLGLTMQKGEMAMTLLPKMVLDLGQPAKSPQAAALRAALAITIADHAFLDEVTDWPAALEHAKKTGYAQTEEELKSKVREPKQGERSVLEPILSGIGNELTVEKGDPDTKVVYPPRFQGLTFYVREFDGVWKVVRFPGM